MQSHEIAIHDIKDGFATYGLSNYMLLRVTEEVVANSKVFHFTHNQLRKVLATRGFNYVYHGRFSPVVIQNIIDEMADDHPDEDYIIVKSPTQAETIVMAKSPDSMIMIALQHGDLQITTLDE